MLLDTPAKLHEACFLLAAETLIQAEAMRQQYELTGRRPWDAECGDQLEAVDRQGWSRRIN